MPLQPALSRNSTSAAPAPLLQASNNAGAGAAAWAYLLSSPMALATADNDAAASSPTLVWGLPWWWEKNSSGALRLHPAPATKPPARTTAGLHPTLARPHHPAAAASSYQPLPPIRLSRPCPHPTSPLHPASMTPPPRGQLRPPAAPPALAGRESRGAQLSGVAPCCCCGIRQLHRDGPASMRPVTALGRAVTRVLMGEERGVVAACAQQPS